MLFQIQTVTETVTTKTISLWEMAQLGGWIMVILALLLLGAVYIFIERLVVLKAAMKEDKTFMNKIRDYIHEGKIESAQKALQPDRHPLGTYDREGYHAYRTSDAGCTGGY